MHNGVIIAVGSQEEVMTHPHAPGAVVDMGGATLMPGLHDLHIHPLMGGLSLMSCRFEQGSPMDVVLSTVATCANEAEPGDWIRGGQWIAAALGDATPDRRLLDQVAPDNPVMLNDMSMHTLWVNSAALAAADITADTPDPAGGLIERDAEGEPTGVLRETATTLVERIAPPITREINAEAMDNAMTLLLSYGVTSITDAVVAPDSLQAYLDLADAGNLQMRVRGCFPWGVEAEDHALFDSYMNRRHDFDRARFRLDCAKTFLDGVPTEGHTAAMLHPYEPGPDGTVKDPARGLLILDPADLNAFTARMDAMGVTVKYHATGDWSARVAFDAIAYARQANGPEGPTHDVAHLTYVDNADLQRAVGLRATLEYSPYLWFPTPVLSDVRHAIGEERADRTWPVREGLDSGALVVAGSDWAVVPSANPWIAIETLVTRSVPGETDPQDVNGAAEAISMAEALDIFTINGARQHGSNELVGTIEPGKIADLILLDRNPLTAPIETVHATSVLRTYIEGDLVYSAQPAE